MQPTHKQFIARLRRFSRRRRHLLNAALGYALGARALATGVLVLLLLSGWLPQIFVNAALFVVAAVVLLVLAVRYLVGWRRFRGEMGEAFSLEELAGDLNSRVVSALDFLGRQEDTVLHRATVERAGRDLETDFERLLDRRARNARRWRCLGLLVVFVALGCTPWFSFARVAANFQASVSGAREYLFPTLYELTPEPGRHVHQLGKTVEVALRFTQYGHRQAALIWQRAGEDEGRREVVVAGDDGVLRRSFSAEVEAEYRLRFEFGQRRTQTGDLVLIFTSRPVLENMQTELVYPAYTRLVPRDLDGVQTRVSALTGTRVTIGFTFSKELEAATLKWDDGTTLPLEVVGRFASLSLIHKTERQATLQVRDEHGFELEYPHSLRFELQADEMPRLSVPRYLKQDMPALAEQLKTFGFGVRARDDYGVSRCVLKWTKATLASRNRVIGKGQVERPVNPPLPQALIEFKNALAGISVRPGDLISFQVEAYDNRAPVPQKVSSAVFSLFIHQAGLEDKGFGDDLAFAGLGLSGGGRLKRAKISNEVGAPEKLKTVEKYRNKEDGDVASVARGPVVRGDYGASVDRYFKLLSTATFREGEDR